MSQKLHFVADIQADVERVWHVMLDDETYRVWTLEFNPGGSWYEGSWEQGSKIHFLGPNPETGELGGMLSEIAENRPYEFVSIRHLGFIVDGKEVTDTPEIQSWAPAYENYTFVKQEDGTTQLIVDLDSMQEWAEMFSEMWPRALKKLKEMCEA